MRLFYWIKKYLILFIFSVSLNSCLYENDLAHKINVGKFDNNLSKKSNYQEALDKTNETILNSYIGFVFLVGEKHLKEDSILISNKKYSILDFISDTSFLHQHYMLDFENAIYFRCTEILKGKYIVIADEETDTKAEIYKSENFKFYSIQEVILNLFSVGFDSSSNKIYKLSSEESNEIKNPDADYYKPIKINGDWLMIEWEINDNVSHGWIKWRKKDTLLIEMFFYA